MAIPSVQVTCNWNRIGGCELSKCVRCEVTHEDIFIKPELDSILGNENAVLLKKEAVKEPCEFHLQLVPATYKIEAVSLVCTAPKLELFLGPLNEYIETSYGELAEDIDAGEVFSYRYDIEVQKSGITELTLKFMTSSNEICVFGTLLQIAPNPNGITTGVNIDFSKFLLSKTAQNVIPPGTTQSPMAEPCMLLLQKFAELQGKSNDPQKTTDMNVANKNQENSMVAVNASPAFDSTIQNYLDSRFEQLERNITERLDIAITEQNAKLDKLLHILENKKV